VLQAGTQRPAGSGKKVQVLHKWLKFTRPKCHGGMQACYRWLDARDEGWLCDCHPHRCTSTSASFRAKARAGGFWGREGAGQGLGSRLLGSATYIPIVIRRAPRGRRRHTATRSFVKGQSTAVPKCSRNGHHKGIVSQ